MGRVQTESLRTFGVAGQQSASEVTNRRPLESGAREGKSPVNEGDDRQAGTRVPQGTRNPVGSRVDHHPRLNTT